MTIQMKLMELVELSSSIYKDTISSNNEEVREILNIEYPKNLPDFHEIYDSFINWKNSVIFQFQDFES